LSIKETKVFQTIPLEYFVAPSNSREEVDPCYFDVITRRIHLPSQC